MENAINVKEQRILRCSFIFLLITDVYGGGAAYLKKDLHISNADCHRHDFHVTPLMEAYFPFFFTNS